MKTSLGGIHLDVEYVMHFALGGLDKETMVA